MDKNARSTLQLTDDDVSRLALRTHDWFIRHPLGTTEEGFDWFYEWLSQELEPFSNGYMNMN